MIDFKRRVADRLKVERTAVDILGVEGVRTFAGTGNQSTSIQSIPPAFADQTKLHGEPEETRKAFGVVRIIGADRSLAIGLQEVGKDGVCMQRDMSKDVMEDVWLR